jgi:hypothetical protein
MLTTSTTKCDPAMTRSETVEAVAKAIYLVTAHYPTEPKQGIALSSNDFRIEATKAITTLESLGWKGPEK